MSASKEAAPQTALCRYDVDSIFYRERNLVEDLIGKASFVDVFASQLLGRQPTAPQMQLIEAVLVTLMEHGLTPSAISARLVYSSSPENIQAGVAAGLLAVGSRFVGTMEEAAVLLAQIVAAPDGTTQASAIAARYRTQRAPVPGFGHHLHKPDDPRATALLALARKNGVAGDQCNALALLSGAVDRVASRHITINTTGAVAAILGDIGIPARLMRGFAVLARAAGLVAHIAEEQETPSGRFIWSLVDGAMTQPVGASPEAN